MGSLRELPPASTTEQEGKDGLSAAPEMEPLTSCPRGSHTVTDEAKNFPGLSPGVWLY